MSSTVLVRSRDHLQQEITVGKHVLYADEPLAAGGDDTGPDPYALLLGALGACTAMTIQLYARRKQWGLQGVEVELSHDSDYTTDCTGCDAQPVKFARITRQLTLQGNLAPEQRTRLADIARKCPVHQTLEGTIIVTDLPAR